MHMYTHTLRQHSVRKKSEIKCGEEEKKSEISLKPFKWLLKIGAQCPLASHAVCIN